MHLCGIELTEASWNCLEKLVQISLQLHRKHSLLKLKIKLSLQVDVKNIKNQVQHYGTMDTVYKGLMLVMLNLHESVDSDQALSNRHLN